MRALYLGLILLLVAGCGTSSSNPDEDNAAKSNTSEKKEITCDRSSIEGQTFEDLSEEEQKMYPIGQVDGSAIKNEEMYKVSAIQNVRQEFLREKLSEQGLDVPSLFEIGNMYMVKGTIVIQLKENAEKEGAVKKVVEQVKQRFNDDAIIVQKVDFSQRELEKMQDELYEAIEDRPSIKEVWNSLGTCTPGNAIEVGVKEELSEEDLSYLKEQIEAEILVEVWVDELTGYVVDTRDDEMLVNSIWFSNAPSGVKVGDRVHVKFGSVAESLPAQSSAWKTEIIEEDAGGEADLSVGEVIKEAKDKAEKEIYGISELEYKIEGDVWVVYAQGDGEFTIEVED
ncbi:DUF3221 domain-containing protein [Halobacillus yeomjeoni]|uniref:DUF3221 domain-containing protein n=1 Tax=Halobacillus yeomjeoni TaxID=311194 RepID=A0A931HWV6_9BACI|nr:DUF3221 domain-containing protein [Halobacillus yeomjeoni]MBH0230845.1 DUF3221 domain-containing protein [Halobacillus yeomjeoni]